MKKLLSIILVITVLLSLVIPVTASSSAIEKNAKIKVWVSDAKVKTAKNIAENFQKKYRDSNVKINVVTMTEYEAGTFMLSDLEAAADVSIVACDQLRNLYHAGCIVPLDSSEANRVKKENNSLAVKACKLGNKTLAYPMAVNGYYLVYDKRVVSAKQAKSFESILKACKKKGKKFIMDAGNGYYSGMFLYTGGLKLKGLEADQVTQKFNKYSLKKLTATVKAYSKLFKKYKKVFSSRTVSMIPSGFTSTSKRKSKVGAGIDGIWDAAANKAALGKKNYGAAIVPKIKVGKSKKQSRVMCGFTSVVRKKGSKYPKAAAEFAKFLSSKSSQESLLKEVSSVPTIKAVQNTSAFKKNIDAKTLVKQTKYAEAQSNLGMIWDPLGNLGNKITAGSINPKKYNYKKLVKKTIKAIKEQ